MKVSELISNLNAMQKEHGDIRVDVALGGWQGKASEVLFIEEYVHEDPDGEIEADVACILIDSE